MGYRSIIDLPKKHLDFSWILCYNKHIENPEFDEEVCRVKNSSRRFAKDPSKKYVRKFRLYLPFAYKSLDKWLNKMSLSGCHVVDSNFISFLFECGEPQNKIYFTYDAGRGRNDAGKYSIPLRYPFLEKHMA